MGLAEAPTGLYTNKINYKCSSCAAHFSTDFYWCWEIYLNWLRMLLLKAQSFPKFFWKKSLNFSYVIRSLTLELAWSWPCYWPLTDNSKTNLVALCRSSSVYLPYKPGTEAEIRVREMAGVGLRVPLSFVGALPALQQVWDLAI